MHRRVHRPSQREPPGQPSRGLGEVTPQLVDQIGAELQIPGVLGGLAVHEPRVRGGDDPLRRAVRGLRGGRLLDQPAHGRRVLLEGNGVVHDLPGLLAGQRLVVAEEIAARGEVGLGGLVVTPVDGVVGPLEQPELGVVDELERRMKALRIEPLELGARHGDAGGDVILHLQLERRQEVLAQTEGAPGAVLVVAHPQELGDQPLAAEPEFVGGRTVDDVHAEAGPPLVAPGGLPEPLDHQHQLPDVRGHRGDPGIVGVGEVFARREQLDDRAEGATRAEDRPPVLAVAGGFAETAREVAGEDLGHPVEVPVEVRHEDRPEEDGVGDGLGDLALATSRHGARLVAEGTLGTGTHQAPGPARHRGRLEGDPEAARQQIVVVAPQADGAGLTGIVPADRQRLDVEAGRLGHVNHRGKAPVDGMALGLKLDGPGHQPGHLGEAVGEVGPMLLGVVLAAQVVPGEDQGPAGMLLLDESQEVGRVADLGLHLLLAVAEIVVGNQRDDDPGGIAGGELEGVAVVVEFTRVVPAHPVATLPFGGLVPVWQADLLLGQAVEMGSEDHAPGVSAPVLGIQARVVLGEHGISGVAEDALHEVEVRDQGTGHKESDLHALLRGDSRHLRADDRADEQRDHARRRLVAGDGEGQPEQVLRRLEGPGQEVGEDGLGHPLLVVGNGKPALGDMKDAGGGPPVGLGVVQDAVAQAVAAEHRRGNLIAVGRQRQDTGQAILVQDEGVARQLPGDGDVGQVIVQEVVDAAVHRARVSGQEAILLPHLGDERLHQRIQRPFLPRQRDPVHAQLGKLEVDVPMEPGRVGGLETEGWGHGKGLAGLGRPPCATSPRFDPGSSP